MTLNPAELSTWTQNMHRLTQTLQQLQAQLDPEPNLPFPEKFSGSRSTYEHFRLDCELLFVLKPRTYATDFIKVRTVILLLLGKIKSWAHNLLLTNSPLLLTWGSFLRAMDAWVDHHQPRRSAQTTVTPREPAPPRREEYGLTVPRSVVGIGGRVRDTGVSRSRSHGGTRSMVAPRGPAPSPGRESSSVVPGPVPAPDMSPDVSDHQRVLQSDLPDEEPMVLSEDHEHLGEEEPMVLGYVGTRSRQTTQEYRKRLGLCFYCGDQEHWISYCPIRPPQTLHRGTLATSSATFPRLLVGHLETLSPVPAPLREVQKEEKGEIPKHNPGGSLKASSKADPCPLTVGSVKVTPESGATPPIAGGSALCTTVDVIQPLPATPAQSPSPEPAPLREVQKEEMPEHNPGGSLDASCREDPCSPTVGSERAQRVKLTGDLKALVAKYAAHMEPGCAVLATFDLPDLRTPGLFADDPYTKDDPCPLAYASDGALLRTEDLEAYEMGLKSCSKKSKKKSKSK